MESLSTSWLWKLVGWLPGFILGWVFTPERFSNLIKMDVRARYNPVVTPP